MCFRRLCVCFSVCILLRSLVAFQFCVNEFDVDGDDNDDADADTDVDNVVALHIAIENQYYC